MLGQARDLRFEYMSLAVVILSVGVLYGMVLGETAVWRSAQIGPAKAAPSRAAPLLVARAGSIATLADLFQRVDYRLDGVQSGGQFVPRIRVDRIPADLHQLGSLSKRKRMFIKLILPLVLSANEQILATRNRLVALRREIDRSGGALAPEDRAWLERICQRYGLEEPRMGVLLERVDVIPPSLALAQAAEESGWGTSRFVRAGNAVFGQRTFVQGEGVVPLRRDGGKTHEVKSFDRLLDSVASYMHNLNIHPAYREFRAARERRRMNRLDLDGYALAGTLKRYSERREAYVRTIRSIIEINGLGAFDPARLAGGEPMRGVEPNV